MSTITSLIITALSLLAPAYSQLTTLQKETLLNDHNALRRQTAAGATVCNGGNCPGSDYMPDMIWDDGLAALAQDYANKCVWGHEGYGDRANRFKELGGGSNFDGYHTGENLASGSCSLTTCPATTRWGEEEALDWTFTASGGECVDGEMCGHFTQVGTSDMTPFQQQ